MGAYRVSSKLPATPEPLIARIPDRTKHVLVDYRVYSVAKLTILHSVLQKKNHEQEAERIIEIEENEMS